MIRVSSSLISSPSASSSSSSARRATWLVRLASVLALAAPLAACADDEEDELPPPSAPAITCTASISPGSFAYQVGDSGRMLVVAPGTIDEETLERVGAPSPSIQGTWLIDDKPFSGGRLRGELGFGAADVTFTAICTTLTNKTGRVSVTASAIITPTQVTINGSATKSIQVK